MIINFKNFKGNDTKYYKIFIDGSIEKLRLALKKLGYYKEFCYDWGIEDFEYDIKNHNGTDETYNLITLNRNSKNKIIYLFRVENYNPNKFQSKIEFSIINNLEGYNTENAEYCGEVHIEDYELNADKYNIF